MSFLQLSGIGKIYVSDSNVAVGIRGVDLSFERGEFVAVTGKSGSGKSTLLNIISGMDTYEEGELFIEGEPTSHYLQTDWEEYRQKYISFVFQDYNIIDSFTVLENVELALMHIEDGKARRARAMELIERVGLRSHAKHKGSRLSGGQKQRTVIARALAKDSPIILADEPTGNLDAETSREIIELLREVSRDKLLIVVTHNFEEVEKYATRHIRIFDGAIEADSVISSPSSTVGTPVQAEEKSPTSSLLSSLKKGALLGKSIFFSKPKLSLFLCLLMTVGTLGIFSVTSFSGTGFDVFEKPEMFSHVDGRVVVTTRGGGVLTESEISALSEKYGAENYLRCDLILDGTHYFELPFENEFGFYDFLELGVGYGEFDGDGIVGRRPEKKNEVLLCLPVSEANRFGRDSIAYGKITAYGLELDVVGIKYYVDNNIPPSVYLTEEGFDVFTAAYYLYMSSVDAVLSICNASGEVVGTIDFYEIRTSFTTEKDTVYVSSQDYEKIVSDNTLKSELSLNAVYFTYDFWTGSDGQSVPYSQTFANDKIKVLKKNEESSYDYYYEYIVMNCDNVCGIAKEMLDSSYKQFSLFFSDDSAARAAAERLQDEGYIAVPSYTTYEPDGLETVLMVFGSVFLLAMWAVSITFLTFFINLCSAKTVEAFRDDMAIMRSMGIEAKVIRVGIYVRMLLSMIPSVILLAIVGIFGFENPTFNGMFTYLYPWHYVLIFIGMLVLTVRVTHKQIGRLFGESVKKALKGGAVNDQA